jgi:hypothetical protein
VTRMRMARRVMNRFLRDAVKLVGDGFVVDMN